MFSDRENPPQHASPTSVTTNMVDMRTDVRVSRTTIAPTVETPAVARTSDLRHLHFFSESEFQHTCTQGIDAALASKANASSEDL